MGNHSRRSPGRYQWGTDTRHRGSVHSKVQVEQEGGPLLRLKEVGAGDGAVRFDECEG